MNNKLQFNTASKQFASILNNVFCSEGIDNKMNNDIKFEWFIYHCFQKHYIKDWGDIDKDTYLDNRKIMKKKEGDLFSAYYYDKNIWVIIFTEFETCRTWICLSEEFESP